MLGEVECGRKEKEITKERKGPNQGCEKTAARLSVFVCSELGARYDY
jgi:hypothetical protein